MYDSRARLISTNLLEIPCIAEPREFRFRVSSEREKQKQTEIKQRTKKESLTVTTLQDPVHC